MFWETASAIIFLLVLFAVWFPLSMLWGFGVLLFSLIFAIIGAFNSHDFAFAFWAGIATAFISGFNAFTDIPVWMWDWAKYSHPWWALFISLCAGGFMSSRD
jgi:hypothetical protein